MKTQSLFSIATGFLFLILCSSCKKEKDEPAPATSSYPSKVIDIVYQSAYNGSYSYNEMGHNSVIEAVDGNYVLLGTKYDGQSDNLSVIKTSSTGAILWQKQFGGTTTEKSGSIINTSDGNILVIGTTQTNPNNWVETKALIIKLNQNGDELWTKIWGNYPQDEGALITETGGGYTAIIKGESVYTPLKIMHMNLNGDSLWTSNITRDSATFVNPNAILTDAAGNYIICGDVDDGSFGSFITKVSASGSVLWKSNFSHDHRSALKSMIQNTNGNYVCAGYSENNSGARNIFVLTIDQNGNEISRKIFSNEGDASSIIQSNDGGYLINTLSSTQGDIVIKTDGNFNIQWSKIIFAWIAESAIQTTSGDYLVTYDIPNPSYYLELNVAKLHPH
jgi:hypothetical protein